MSHMWRRNLKENNIMLTFTINVCKYIYASIDFSKHMSDSNLPIEIFWNKYFNIYIIIDKIEII
jgi:hypothetical protein